MKIDLPNFNSHLHVEDFLDLLNKVETFFEFMKIHEDKGECDCTQIERKSFYLVGANINFKDMTKECAYKIIDKDEASNEGIIFTRGL